MAQRYESKSNAERLTDAEISEVIRYLEPKPPDTTLSDGAVLAICIGLLSLMAGLMGFIWLWP